MPQLASGEIGWAIDTQELYIGNGAVSEGAPAVGNTKVLTEHDNIFDYADVYAYKPTDNFWGAVVPTERTLQERLDETVSILSFGATGDGTVDQTVEIQNALDQLYLNDNVDDRVILYFPPGEYLLTDTVYVPPFARIVGAGKDKTIFKASQANVFQTVNSTSVPGSYNEGNTTSLYDINPTQARHIECRDFTVEITGNWRAFNLIDVANSSFDNIKITGGWTTGDVSAGIGELRGINLTSTSTSITCLNNRFTNIEFDGLYHGIYSDYDIRDNIWNECLFYMLRYGVSFGEQTIIGQVGQATGPYYNLVSNSKFDMIDQEGINITNGEYNTSKGNTFLVVGTDGAAQWLHVTSCIGFSSFTNVSDADFFERTQYISKNRSDSGDTYSKKYLPEINGRSSYRNIYRTDIAIGEQIGSFELLKFPLLSNGTILIDYIYTEDTSTVFREGTLEIVSNPDFSTVFVSDNYNYNGPATYNVALAFTVSYADNDGDLTDDTVSVSCTNNMPVGVDNFSYSIRTKV